MMDCCLKWIVSEWINRRVDEWVNRRIDRNMNGWIVGALVRLVPHSCPFHVSPHIRFIVRIVGGRIGKWVGGWMDG